MNELEETLSSILSDPGQMEKIAGLARSLMGDGEAAPPQTPDAGLVRSLMNSAAPGREQALLQAMRPYLSEKRREKLDRALQLARLARVARLAMETGGADDPAH